ncbi:hypothetical protein [Larkinella arboricola]|uniref:Viral A-type inclusion protein n=1 Tax=Larkinella arboricola TaxID=643671 RepID=A0A327X033_LARAB|nr:hypothetical protein [Larkinella arboricola]RAJ99810.1 hypothetical protein LX87_01506 [Larkinella arboricola]
MKSNLLSTVLVSLLVTACQQSDDKKEIQQIQDQVMAVHDEVMPHSDELMDLKEKISKQIDSLSKVTPATASLKSRQQEGIAINQSLTEADSLMYDWMNHYRADTLTGMDAAQAKIYLDRELAKITVVKEKINSGITEAKKFLGR